MLLVRYDLNLDRSENRVELRLPSFYPKQAVVFPKEATHFQLVAATAAIDFSHAPFIPQRPPLVMEKTELLSVVGQVPALSFSLPIDEALGAGPVIVLVGISYLESLQGEIYPIKDKESARGCGSILTKSPVCVFVRFIVTFNNYQSAFFDKKYVFMHFYIFLLQKNETINVYLYGRFVLLKRATQ